MMKRQYDYDRSSTSRRKSNRTNRQPDRLSPHMLSNASYGSDYARESRITEVNPHEKVGKEFWNMSDKLPKKKQFLGKFVFQISDSYAYYPLKHGGPRSKILNLGTHGVHYANNFAELGYMVEKYSNQIMNWPDLPCKIEKTQNISKPSPNEREQEETKEVIIIDDFDTQNESASEPTTIATQNDEQALITTQAKILSTYSKTQEQETTRTTSPIINIEDSPTTLSTKAASHNNTQAAFMPSFSSLTALSAQATFRNNTHNAFMPSFSSHTTPSPTALSTQAASRNNAHATFMPSFSSPTALSTQAASHNNTHAAFMPSFSSPTALSTQAASHNNTHAAFMPSFSSPHLRLKTLENEVFGKEEGYKCLLTRLRDLEDFVYGRMERDKIMTTGYGMEFRLYRLEKELRVRNQSS